MNQTKQLNLENNRLDEQLDGEYESVMTDLVCYLRGADITDGQAERVRRDLLEMFIAARERGEDVQTLIGGDYRQFCDAILENVPRRTVRQRVVNALSIALTCAGVLGLSKTLISPTMLGAIRALAAHQVPELGFPVSLGMLAAMVILSVFACAVVQYTCKTAFQERPGRAKRTHLLVTAAVSAGVIGAAIALEVLLEGVVLFRAPLYAAVAAALACLGGGYALWWEE